MRNRCWYADLLAIYCHLFLYSIWWKGSDGNIVMRIMDYD